MQSWVLLLLRQSGTVFWTKGKYCSVDAHSCHSNSLKLLDNGQDISLALYRQQIVGELQVGVLHQHPEPALRDYQVHLLKLPMDSGKI